MPSRTIRPTQAPEPAPFAYTVAAPAGFTPEAVTASWDGTGAGGDFLPCVSYYNAEGVLLDRAFPDTGAVTAGDTAEVSYRPFKRGGGGGGGSALDTTDGVTSVNPTTTLTIDGGLALLDLGGGNARLSSAAVVNTFTTAYVVTQTSPALGGGNFPRLVLTQMYGAGVTYGTSTFGNHGTTWTITRAGLYLLGYNISEMFTSSNVNPAILSFGPDILNWQAGDAPFPFGSNSRFRLATSYNGPQGPGVDGPQGGAMFLRLSVGDILSFGLGSFVNGVNVTVNLALVSLVKVG